MNYRFKLSDRYGLLRNDLDYHVVRASMVLIFLMFDIRNASNTKPSLDPVHQQRPAYLLDISSFWGASWFRGVSEWLFGALIFAGFWNKKAGALGALGGIASFVSTITTIPFMPDVWNASAGGFPAMQGNVAFLMKDFVLLAVSVYLLKQDLLRLSIGEWDSSGVSGSHEFSAPAGTLRKSA
ncbi:MAG TPA: DUF417 family protein [Terracidiphilus sp.]|jgi:uncharacterized membrane protein YkgB